MKSSIYIKLAIGAVLFLTWVTLVVLKVSGTEDIISFIKVGLGGLGIYHSLMTTPGGPDPAPAVEVTPGLALAPSPVATTQDAAPASMTPAPAPVVQTLQ